MRTWKAAKRAVTASIAASGVFLFASADSLRALDGSPTPRPRAVELRKEPSTVLKQQGRVPLDSDSNESTPQRESATAEKRGLAPEPVSPMRQKAEAQVGGASKPQFLADLAFGSIKYMKGRAEMTIANQGKGDAKPFRVSFTAGSHKESWQMQGLKAGETKEIRSALVPMNDLLGVKTVKIDADNVVAESNEKNNTSASNFPPGG